jgi:hypothetical protein
MLLGDVCYLQRGIVISEEIIYRNYSESNIPIYSSNTSNNGIIGKTSSVFFKEQLIKGKSGDITWTTDGNAGNFKLRNQDFLFTNVCGKLTIKNKYKEKVLGEWLEIYLNSISEKYITSKGGNAKLMKEQVRNIEIEIPPLEKQKEIIKHYKKRRNLLIKLNKIKIKIRDNLNNNVSYLKKEFLIKDLFYVSSGIRITQENIYNNKGNFPVITSKTTEEGIAWYGDYNWLSTFKKNEKSLIVEQECLTWTKDGAKCGTIFYRNYPFFPNDHCGVLIPKIPLNLNWIRKVLQPITFNYVVAKDGQGMLYEEQMSNVKIELPVKINGEIDIELQNEIYEEYKKLNTLLKKIDSLIEKYSI